MPTWARVCALFGVMVFGSNVLGQVAPATQPAGPLAELPASAESKIMGVTVYEGTALVTRQVQVKEGKGLVELVVGPLPPQTIDSSLFTESSDGIRVLTSRYRTRAVAEDTRAEVRSREEQIHKLTDKNQELAKQLEVIGQDIGLLTKLENFTAATLQQLTDKGQLNADNTIKLANYMMERRAADGQQQVTVQQETAANQEQIQLLQRQISELAAGTSRTEREAVIVVDKSNAAAGQVRLNYLVNGATWQPQYKLRSAGEKDPVQVEYLGSVSQQSGEDWSDVELVLSTATPRLNAAPPDLLALEITVVPPGQNQAAMPEINKMDAYRRGRGLRQQAAQEFVQNRGEAANGSLNTAAAAEQFGDLLAREDASGENPQAEKDGPSVSYHLATRMTVPSRNDQQLVEVARIELAPDYFYKTVPVLSPHVYRLAELTNRTQYVLLPGEATMYVGTDFVGRTRLPLVAIGEKFTAGFGVDPQIQVDRELVSKTRSIQGGNQVQTYQYRLRISSYKQSPVNLQVWDRLPHGQNEAVAVELVSTTPALSQDAEYLRVDRPKNLLRWDLTIKPDESSAATATIDYEFKLQYDRNLAIGDLQPAKR